MRSKRSERGQGRIGTVIALALLGIGVYIGAKIIPVRIAAFEFEDFVEQECRYAAVKGSDEEIARRIMEKARDLEIPLDKKNLRVTRTRSEMIVAYSYVQPIDFKVTTYNYRFEHKYRTPLF